MRPWFKNMQSLETRGYALGERRPETLPGVYADSENIGRAAEADARWAKARNSVKGVNGVGRKY